MLHLGKEYTNSYQSNLLRNKSLSSLSNTSNTLINNIDTEQTQQSEQSISNLSTANFNIKKHNSFSEGDNEISFNITPEEDEIKKENFIVTNYQSKLW